MAVALQLPAPRSRASALSMAALGIGLVVLIGITWGTGLLYITSRAGLPSPVRLAIVDSVHIYVGLAAAVFFGLKVWRVGFRRKVAGVPNLSLWQRWVSWSLVILYPAIFLTGFAAVLPLGGAWKESMVQAHLLTSVWSLVPTTLHLIHHRARAAAHLIRPGARRLRPRLLAGIAIAALPAVLWLPYPRAVSPASEAGVGGAWVPSGLQGVSLDQIAVSADGTYLVAAGDGIYVSDARGRSWHHLDVGGPAPGAHNAEPIVAAPAAASAAAPTEHRVHAVPPGDISVLTPARGPVAIYAGSSAGLYSTADTLSPFTQDHFPGGEVRAIAVDPSNPFERWVATGSGVWFTWVFGHGWTNESNGLTDPNGSSALSFFHNELYASDLAGVYRWDASSATWLKVLDALGVTSLTSNQDLLVANSFTSGIAIYDGHSWRQVGSGLSTHAHARGESSHVIDVSAPPGGGLFLVESGRVGFSADAGRSWSELGRGLPQATWAVTRYRDRAYVATSDGLYSYKLETAPQDSPSWWLIVLAVALVAGVVGAVVAVGSGKFLRRPQAAAGKIST
ncbi:MAG: hypothetical protein PVS2B1_11240 [Candidatus Dormibacteraceae bacterium]